MHAHAQSHTRVENARSIHVDAHTTLVRAVAYLAHCAHRVHGSAGHVVRLLDADSTGGRAVRAEGADLAAHLVPAQQSTFGADRTQDAAAEPGDHGELVIDEVR